MANQIGLALLYLTKLQCWYKNNHYITLKLRKMGYRVEKEEEKRRS
jgi:hypothetical protein